MKINSVAKGIIAALVAGLGALQVASTDGRITTMEWIQVASALAAAYGFVWGVPNTPVEPAPVVAPPAETPVVP